MGYDDEITWADIARWEDDSYEDDDDGEPYEDDAWADSETLASAGWGEWD